MALRAKVHIGRAAHGRVVLSDEAPAKSAAASAGRVPRVAKLMALAIRFDGLLREGKVASLTELARLARVTQPRVTQILNLTLLAPDIQELLLTLESADAGRDRVHERLLRRVVSAPDWQVQRQRWKQTVGGSSSEGR